MTEHNPIKPPKPEGGEEEKSSLLERASGAFGLSNLGAAPMPRSLNEPEGCMASIFSSTGWPSAAESGSDRISGVST